MGFSLERIERQLVPSADQQSPTVFQGVEPRDRPLQRRTAQQTSGRRESNPRSQLGNPIDRFEADDGERKTAGQRISRTSANDLE